jgi:hypothetical protein
MMARNEILPEVPPPSLCSSERVKSSEANTVTAMHVYAEAIRMCRHRNASTGSAAID